MSQLTGPNQSIDLTAFFPPPVTLLVRVVLLIGVNELRPENSKAQHEP